MMTTIHLPLVHALQALQLLVVLTHQPQGVSNKTFVKEAEAAQKTYSLSTISYIASST